MSDGHWMERAFNPQNRGKLHRELGVPLGKKIPAKKLETAPKSLAKQVALARTGRKVGGK